MEMNECGVKQREDEFGNPKNGAEAGRAGPYDEDVEVLRSFGETGER